MRFSKTAAVIAAIVTVTTLGACGQTPTADPGPTSAPVAEIASDSLVRAGHLTTCMDMPYQPFQYFDDAGAPTGVDIDLITEVSARLGLEASFQNSVFDTIIAALKGGKCDLIWADQYVTPERLEQLDMVPYWQAAEVVVVAEGNPQNIGTRHELCGVKVAGQKGGADVATLEALSADCEAAGDEPINILQFPRSPDAYQALASGQVDAWMTEKVAALLLKDEKDAAIEFTDDFLLGEGDTAGLTAFSFRPDDAAVSDAVLAAVDSMVEDGTWAEIWDKWGLSDITVDPAMID